jgi:peptide chain release factor 3
MTPNHGFSREIARRRTLAIISHPDAGKTTLTEKLLLYGGAVELAGAVTSRKHQRATASDWMELERQRGISVSSTVLPFDYRGYRLNLLDTPGHRDFSEDTYRVLTAVDAVVMVIDAVKGIESQTLKLFEVCRDRAVPIFTFINKLDRPAREPLDLLDEVASTLGISAYPVNWPLGTGDRFRGVWDRKSRQVHLFTRLAGGASRAAVVKAGLDDAIVREKVDEQTYAQACEEISLLDLAGADYDPEAWAAAQATPVYFGSAIYNFGVELLLDGLLEHGRPPEPRTACGGQLVAPDSKPFSGFVFKIQANMDPQHRDRVAFVRIVSGRFSRDMAVHHRQSGKKVRLSNVSRVFGAERETVDEAYPGDVVGIVGKSLFAIGDTLSEVPELEYDEIPAFAPESFACIESANTAQSKRFRSGMEQLLQEGVAQAFTLPSTTGLNWLIGAGGPLQFDVMQYRLETEYGADSRWTLAPWKAARWLRGDTLADLNLPSGCATALDKHGARVILFPAVWTLEYFEEKNPAISLSKYPTRYTRSRKNAAADRPAHHAAAGKEEPDAAG